MPGHDEGRATLRELAIAKRRVVGGLVDLSAVGVRVCGAICRTDSTIAEAPPPGPVRDPSANFPDLPRRQKACGFLGVPVAESADRSSLQANTTITASARV